MKEQAGEDIKKSLEDLKKQVGVKILQIIKMTLGQHMSLKENEGDHLNQSTKSKWTNMENK